MHGVDSDENALVSMTIHVFPKLGYHAVDTIAIDVREKKKGAGPFGKTSPKSGRRLP